MIDVKQRPLGKSWDEQSASIGYVVICTEGESEDEVEAAVFAEAPESYRGLVRATKVKAEEINVGADGEPSMWDVVVSYGRISARLTPPVTGSVVWRGTTTGGTQHITSPLYAGNAYTHPDVTELPEDWGYAIGPTKDGVGGLDIPVMADSFSATKYVAVEDWPALRAAIKSLTGKVNSEDWTADGELFEAGEVLFLGATYAKRTDVDPPDYEVTFEFAASPNDDDFDVGEITGIAKLGWEYLDITYEDRESEGFLYKVPIIATIHGVFRQGNFSGLGL